MYFYTDLRPAPSVRLRPGTMPVVIFYEDIAAAERALRSLRDYLRSRGDPRELQPMLWQTGLLEHAHWIRLATCDAARAELCVVSLGHEPARSSSITHWFRELAPLNAARWITLSPFEAIADRHDFLRAPASA
jgi:hypothetical protein